MFENVDISTLESMEETQIRKLLKNVGDIVVCFGVVELWLMQINTDILNKN